MREKEGKEGEKREKERNPIESTIEGTPEIIS